MIVHLNSEKEVDAFTAKALKVLISLTEIIRSTNEGIVIRADGDIFSIYHASGELILNLYDHEMLDSKKLFDKLEKARERLSSRHAD